MNNEEHLSTTVLCCFLIGLGALSIVGLLHLFIFF